MLSSLLRDVSRDPFDRFSDWLDEAARSEPNDPNAMSLATCDTTGRPNLRMVLLKGHDGDGLVFYTNALSAKGEELCRNPHAAACFHWKALRRQVRFRGSVDMIDGADADDYFASRPRQSRIAAWASPQSQPIPEGATLEERVEAETARFKDAEPPRPPHWGGYRIVPLAVEFWVGDPHRLHDRLLYERPRIADPWSVHRLYP